MKYFFVMQYQTWRKRWVRVHVWRNRRRRVLLEVVHIFLIKVVDEYWEVVVPTFLEIFVYKMKISLFTFYFLAISRRRHRSISGTKDLTFFFRISYYSSVVFLRKNWIEKNFKFQFFDLGLFFCVINSILSNNFR
jgi:hypothetical protein